MTGWIKLHRRILESGLLNHPNALAVFCWLLLTATHKDRNHPTKYGVIKLKRGQVVTGRKILAHKLELSERNIRTALDLLSRLEITTIETTKHYSVITLVNYSKYQSMDDEATNKVTNTRPTPDQHPTTEQECKELKEYKEDKKGALNPFGHLTKSLTDSGVILSARQPTQIGMTNNLATKHGERLFKAVVEAYVTDDFLREKSGLSVNGFLNQFGRLASKQVGKTKEADQAQLWKERKRQAEADDIKRRGGM